MKPCNGCGELMRKKPKQSHAQWTAQKFCSRECSWRNRPTTSVSERMWSRVDKSGECWIWTGATTPGGKYGVIGKPGSRGNILTHVAAYLEFVGPVPAGWQVDHLCRVTLCCNPAHLEAVTQAENLRRQAAAVTRCPFGHEYTPENTYHPPATPEWRQCRKCIKRRTAEAARRRRELRAAS